jgi:hypothetical protein
VPVRAARRRRGFLSRRFGHDGPVTERSGDELLALPVRLHGVQLARAVDLLLDRDGLRAVGLDLLCGDGVRRFLALPTAAIDDEQVAVLSALVFREADELEFYRSRTVALSALRGGAVERKGEELGRLVDVVVGPAGELRAMLVEQNGRTARLPYGGTLKVAPRRRSAA